LAATADHEAAISIQAPALVRERRRRAAGSASSRPSSKSPVQGALRVHSTPRAIPISATVRTDWRTAPWTAAPVASMRASRFWVTWAMPRSASRNQPVSEIMTAHTE
jgi:hypothetical protein